MLPTLTDEQRVENLKKAKHAREYRTDIQAQIKKGLITIPDVIVLAQTDKIIARMKVSSLIRCARGYGRAKTESLMSKIGIAQNRRLGGLGRRQIEALEELFGEEA